MYDILVVGAGISAATLCEKLKRKYKILVMDVRDHLGGNCYDYNSNGGRVHTYGPHIFHCPWKSREVLDFIMPLAKQGWEEYQHSVTAEVKLDGKYVRTSFPFSKDAAKTLGKNVSPEEVLDLYFKGYSYKMWGKEWDALPAAVKGRVPKDTNDMPVYFPDQFVGFPKGGYTPMLENMFDGCDILLNAEPTQWETISARQVVYCGRPDRIRDGQFPIGSKTIKIDTGLGQGYHEANWLDFVTLDIKFMPVTSWDVNTPIFNICHTDLRATRLTHYGRLHNNGCNVVSVETPNRYPTTSDMTPFYPYPSEINVGRMNRLRPLIKALRPNLHLLGRLAQFKYIDMFQAIGAGMKLADDLDVALKGSAA